MNQVGHTIKMILVATALLVAMTSSAAMGDIFSRESFTLGTTTLPYRCAEVCHDGNPVALVLYLHGGSSRGNDNEAQLNEAAVGIIYQYLVDHNIAATFIVPQCPAGGGWTGTLRRVVNELLKSRVNAGDIDDRRIYVMGGSMGGTGTWCQLSYFPDFYAAAMPVAGNPTGMDTASVATTPVYTVMGTADNIMSIDIVEEFQTEVIAAGGTFILDVETGWTHQNTCEQSYTDARLGWLFSQIRGSDSTLVGDVNNDGKVNVSDVTKLINMILGVVPMSQTRADVNADGKVNVSDITALINIILGIL